MYCVIFPSQRDCCESFFQWCLQTPCKIIKLLPYCLSILAYGTSSVGCVLLEECDNLSLLGRGAAAADHGWTLARKLYKLVLIIAQAHLQYSTHEDSPWLNSNTLVLAAKYFLILSLPVLLHPQHHLLCKETWLCVTLC